MIAADELIGEALHLSQTDRSYIAKKLIESLDIEETFTAEELKIFNRRSREIRDGTVEPLSLEQLQRNVSGQLA
jgi:Putative addiction module component